MRRRVVSADDGFGIVEIIVAMALIAIVLMALAPFLISSFQVSARHIRIAGASTEVDSRIANVIQADTCQELSNLSTPNLEVLPPNRRNVEYRVEQSTYSASSADFSVQDCRDLAVDTGIATYYYVVYVYDQSRYDVSNPGTEANTPLAVGRTWVSVKE